MEDERYIIGFGVLNCDQHRGACGQAQIHQYPMLKVYEGDERYAHTGLPIRSQHPDEIYNAVIQNVHSLRRKPKKAKSSQAKDELWEQVNQLWN